MAGQNYLRIKNWNVAEVQHLLMELGAAGAAPNPVVAVADDGNNMENEDGV